MSVKRKAKEQKMPLARCWVIYKEIKAIEENTNNIIASSSTSDSASGNTANACAGVADKVDSISIITPVHPHRHRRHQTLQIWAAHQLSLTMLQLSLQGQAFTVLEAGDIITNAANFWHYC